MPISVLNIDHFESDSLMPDFYSNRLDQHLESNKGHFQKPHRHNFYLCVVFSNGSGVHEIDFKKYPLGPGSVFFLKPGQTHFWQFSQQPKGYIFFHSREFIELQFTNNKLEMFPYYFSMNNSPLLQLSEGETLPIVDQFSVIDKEFSLDLPLKRQKLCNLTTSLYIDLARRYGNNYRTQDVIPVPYLETLRKLEKLVEKEFKLHKSPNYYAEKLNISTKHLNRIVQSTLSQTTSGLIQQRVMLEAKRLITHSDHSLLEISENLGFNDYAYFSKVFKYKTGITPVNFLKKYKTVH
ncbi:helix-turn-helix transcriptional regulator [Echinicola sp. 20G]|uniref:AraC family transcriptional regulator n=1 Tax=Echinicola sp. 20G TaxID=2781961 RepID=UPI00190FE761|nr:helix-turn-helix transcriptional regulator [Echinicola sp. 20G]